MTDSLSDWLVQLHKECVIFSKRVLWYKMTELEKQNGDLRRQLDDQLYTSKPDVNHDNPDELSREELVRRYCKLCLVVVTHDNRTRIGQKGKELTTCTL